MRIFQVMLERVHQENCKRDRPLSTQAVKQSQVTILSVIRFSNSFRPAVMAASLTTAAHGQPFAIVIVVPGGYITEFFVCHIILHSFFCRKVKVAGRHWSGDISARSNQDNQREFEERAMKQVIALVGKRTGSDININYHSYQQGGTYVRLEAEWRESMKHKPSGTKNKSNK